MVSLAQLVQSSTLSLGVLLISTGAGAGSIAVTPTQESVGTFETTVMHIALVTEYENPYDPEDIRVDLIIERPSGATLTHPCFFRTGTPELSVWEARWTPIVAGTYHVHVESRAGHETLVSPSSTLEVRESTNDGFLRLNPASNASLVFDSGKRFRGIGMNLGWEFEPKWGGHRTYTYESYIAQLERNHANFIRTWMCPWNLPLEWTRFVRYPFVLDELTSWDLAFSHSPGLELVTGTTTFTEDDESRVVLTRDQPQTLVYNIPDLKNFKLKLFFRGELSPELLRCSYSPDNRVYTPAVTELSRTWSTTGGWQRVFCQSLGSPPVGTSFLKIEIAPPSVWEVHLAGIKLGYGEPSEIIDAPGLGRYYEATASRLDEVLSLAKRHGIYVMLAHDYHGVFRPTLDSWGANDEWRRNPYNADNGGPCATPTEFFTSPEARRIYKHRLRYMVARWGYSPVLACFEFFNEIDLVMLRQQVSAADITAWHQEMADYLKSIDIHGHLVSTSSSHNEVPGLFEIPNLDLTQYHRYGPVEQTQQVLTDCTAAFAKPCVMGEFSIGWKGPGWDFPVELYEGALHDGIWRGMFTPTPILPMTWWWEWHLEQGEYVHFLRAAELLSLMLEDDDEQLEPLAVSCPDAEVEVLGVIVGEQIFLWLKSTSDTPRVQLQVVAEALGSRAWSVRWYDTWNGGFSVPATVDAVEGRLALTQLGLPAQRDIAVLLRP